MNKRLNATLSRHKVDEETRRMLIHQITDGRTESRAQMTDDEAHKLMSLLNATHLDSANRMRRKMIALAREQGWETETGACDIERLDAWCKKYGQFKKGLNQHSRAELAKLISQFEKVYASNLIKK